MEELWQIVAGFEGHYEISSYGRLRRTPGSPGGRGGRLIEHVQVCPKGGYLQYRMRLNSKKTARYIHRLVAEHFVDGFGPAMQVNHIDGNKRNNRADNLEWVTLQQNIAHSCETGLNPRYRGDLVGRQFGDLLILEKLPRSMVKVSCSCGRTYVTSHGHIVNGQTRKCFQCWQRIKARMPKSRKH